MKSIKPGRGPSAMGAIGSIAGIIFGIFWTIMALTITAGAPFPMVHIFFPLFGLVFVGIGIVNLIYNATNATSRNRMSTFDITDDAEESDPADALIRGGPRPPGTAAPVAKKFCPHCGTAVQPDSKFCPQCGNALS